MGDAIGNRFLVLGLGNELLSDDGIGILAADSLQGDNIPGTDVTTSSMHGLALIDYFIGYEKAIIIDAICTKKHAPGTIIEMGLDDLSAISAPSPHYTGLPEIMAIARDLELDFPSDFVIYAIVVSDVSTIQNAVGQPAGAAIELVKQKIKKQIAVWNN